MNKKTAIIILCSSTLGLCMEKIEVGDNSLSLSKSNPSKRRVELSPAKKTEFMKNGLSLSRSMPAHEKLEYMRNGQQVIQQLSSEEETTPTKQLSEEETTPFKNEKPFIPHLEMKFKKQEKELAIKSPLKEDEEDKLAEQELINYVSNLSLEEHRAIINQAIQKEKANPEKNITINYNVKIKQKLKKSSQNINLGNKNNNKNKNY